MKVEHFALQVTHPVALADWYVNHLGLKLVRSGGEPSYGRFLADSAGSVLLEVYRNPKVPVPDYHRIDPLLLHLAFLSDDLAADRDRLVSAGARVVEDVTTTAAGDQLLMLRDPWGIGLQFVNRAKPMVLL